MICAIVIVLVTSCFFEIFAVDFIEVTATLVELAQQIPGVRQLSEELRADVAAGLDVEGSILLHADETHARDAAHQSLQLLRFRSCSVFRCSATLARCHCFRSGGQCFCRGLHRVPFCICIRHCSMRCSTLPIRSLLCAEVYHIKAFVLQLLSELVDASAGDHPSFYEDADAVGYFLDLVELVGGDQDGTTILDAQLTNQRGELTHAGRVDAEGRLIHDDDFRILHENIGDTETLSHTT